MFGRVIATAGSIQPPSRSRLERQGPPRISPGGRCPLRSFRPPRYRPPPALPVRSGIAARDRVRGDRIGAGRTARSGATRTSACRDLRAGDGGALLLAPGAGLSFGAHPYKDEGRRRQSARRLCADPRTSRLGERSDAGEAFIVQRRGSSPRCRPWPAGSSAPRRRLARGSIRRAIGRILSCYPEAYRVCGLGSNQLRQPFVRILEGELDRIIFDLRLLAKEFRGSADGPEIPAPIPRGWPDTDAIRALR